MDSIASLVVFVVEDDPDTNAFARHALERAGFDVASFTNPQDALDALSRVRCRLLLTDVRLPGMTGLELLSRARSHRPDLPILLMTAYAELEDSITALRAGADDFLLKPLTIAGLRSAVAEVLAKRSANAGRTARRVVAIGAHPDDVELGVGGTLAAHVDAGDQVTILTLSRGESGGPAASRAVEAQRAADVLGVELELCDLPDTRLPASGRTVELIEDTVRRTRASTVYTHSLNDVHQDHRAVHQASLVACRSVSQVFTYQSPSATVDFVPRRFIPIDTTLDRKLAAIACYRTQTEKCAYLADDLLRATSRYWGRFVGSDYAEPLEIVHERTEPTHHERTIPLDRIEQSQEMEKNDDLIAAIDI
ncbi:MAG: PIG-L family deacetylase [Actinomycetota bacterium]